MKIKKEYIILAIIIIALSLYLILRNPNRTFYELPEIPSVSGKNISKIEISSTKGTIVLNKKDDQWTISPEGYLADTDKVKNMVDTIKDLTLTALVSESKNYERYHLNNEKRIMIKAWDGDTLSREFEVGKTASSFRHTFIKIANDDHVYHARGNFRDKFDKTAGDLRDKTVLSFNELEMQEIKITKGKKSIRISREQLPVEIKADQAADTQSTSPPKEETVWISTDNRAIDSSIMRRMTAALTNMQCEKYIDDLKKDDFMDPVYTLAIKGIKEYTLSIFTPTEKYDNNYPAISSENDDPFVFSKHRVENIIKLMDEILNQV